MLIGGDPVDALDGADLRRRQPGDGEPIASAPLGGRGTWIARSRRRSGLRGPQGWSGWAAAKRGRTLAEVRRPGQATTRNWPQLESRNTGKPIKAARGETFGASLVFEYYVGAANKLFGQTIPASMPGLDFTLREPIGVVGLIVPGTSRCPWPPGSLARRSPPEHGHPEARRLSPLTAIRLAELALEAGFPPASSTS